MSVVAAQLNGIHSPSTPQDLAALQKSLPHVDLETGLRNRVVKRDPITGLGSLPKEHNDLSRSRTPSGNRRQFNATLISWDADTAVVNSQGNRSKNGTSRNPITLSGDLGSEVDTLRTTSRPRSGKPREPQRDPISGQGNFGEREWDPIGKYTGRIRRAKSTTAIRCNPLTGENAKTFTVTAEEKRCCMSPGMRRNSNSRNILTGENCAGYFISSELKSPKKRMPKSPPRNTITGDNCQTYDVNAETRHPRSRTPATKSNPLSGENMNTFLVSKEDRPRSAKPYVYTNTVTGENVQSYKITPIEKRVTPRVQNSIQNPLSGENVDSYTYRMGERKKIVKQRDISSPLTGGGSRGLTYTVSVEERHQSQPNKIWCVNGNTSDKLRLKSPGQSRNVLTGENCETYLVCQEMRSEKPVRSQSSNGNGSSGASYNILTGE